MKIGFQGDIGSNSEAATLSFIDKCKLPNTRLLGLLTSKNVVSALLNKEIDYGVMALYNSIAGEVIETKNALTPQISLLEKVDIPIHHCIFIKHPEVEIKYIASHIQALQQTKQYRKHILKNAYEIECPDTALAAKMLFNGEYPDNYAIICRKNAGEFYNLHLYAENIEDDNLNKTTFGLFTLRKEFQNE